LIHAQWASIPAGVGAAMAHLMGIRFAFTGHAYDLYHQGIALRAKIARACFVATCTDANRDHLQNKAPGSHRKRIHLIRHWIATPPPYAPRPNVPRDRSIKVLSVGSLVPYKGFDMLIRAAAIANQQQPVLLTIVGDGPEKRSLRALAEKLHLDIQMPGSLPQREVFQRLADADVFALASMPDRGPSDNLPNVLVESAFAGVPFVMTEVGSVGELVEDGVTGLLVPPGNPRALAKAILRLAGDDSLRQKVTANARRRVESMFSLESNASRLERLVRSALTTPTKRKSSSHAAA
jgi:glycosyltransferase involved in cell wall biosynthesis